MAWMAIHETRRFCALQKRRPGAAQRALILDLCRPAQLVSEPLGSPRSTALGPAVCRLPLCKIKRDKTTRPSKLNLQTADCMDCKSHSLALLSISAHTLLELHTANQQPSRLASNYSKNNNNTGTKFSLCVCWRV